MAKLPSVQDMGQRPTPQPGSAVFGYNPGDAGAAAGGILAQTGNQIMRTGEQMYEVAKVEKTKADTIGAEDAFNTLRQAEMDLTYGEKGFANRKGANAVKGSLFQDYNKLLKTEIDRISSGLANEEQRSLFQRRANGITVPQFGERVLRHMQTEGKSYTKDVFAGTIATEARAAGAAWNDPNAISTSLVRVKAAA